MKTWLKVALGLIALSVLLVIALTVAVVLVFEPNDYRAYLIEQVEQNTGRSFEMTGDLSLDLFPCCSVGVRESTLGNPPDMTSGTFAKVDSAELSLNLWPLLTRREIQVGQVSAAGVYLSLLRLADGRVNWAFESETNEPTSATNDSSAIGRLSVAGIAVEGASIDYRDEQANTRYVVRDMNLNAGDISVAANGDIALEMELVATVVDEGDGTTVSASFASAMSIVEERVTLREPRLDLKGTSPLVEAERISAPVRAEQLELLLRDSTLLSATKLHANIELEALQPINRNVQAAISVGSLEFDVDAAQGRLGDLLVVLDAADVQLEVTGAGSFGGDGAVLEGSANLKRADLRRLMEAAGAAEYLPEDDQALTRLAASTSWGLRNDTLDLPDLNVRLDDTVLAGSLALVNFERPATRFELALDRLNIDAYAPPPATGSPAAAAAPEPTRLPLDVLQGLNIDGTLHIRRVRASQLDFSEVRLTAREREGDVTFSAEASVAGGSFTLQGTGNVAGSNPQLAGNLTVQSISPRQLLAAMQTDIETADAALLQSLSGNTGWRLESDRVALQKMHWQLDRTNLRGGVSIENLDTLAAAFDVNVDRLNLDGYLAPDDTSDANSSGAAVEAEIPVQAIRDLQLSGQVQVAELTVADLQLQQVAARVQAAQGVLRLAPLTAKLYGGDYQGTITIDANGPQARLELAQKLNSVQVSEILRSLYDSDRLAGSLTLEFAGSGAGNTQSEILKVLQGDLTANLTDGVYRGMDIGYEVQRARALLRKEPTPTPPQTNETAIRALSMAGTMSDGTLQTNRLRAELPYLRLAGKGGLDVVDLALDYQLNAEVLRGGGNLDDIAEATIPLTITGPLASPKVGVDMKSLVTTAIRDKVTDRARDALQDRLGRGLDEPANPESTEDPSAEQPKKKASTKDLLKRSLQDLLKPPPSERAEDSNN